MQEQHRIVQMHVLAWSVMLIITDSGLKNSIVTCSSPEQATVESGC